MVIIVVIVGLYIKLFNFLSYHYYYHIILNIDISCLQSLFPSFLNEDMVHKNYDPERNIL